MKEKAYFVIILIRSKVFYYAYFYILCVFLYIHDFIYILKEKRH